MGERVENDGRLVNREKLTISEAYKSQKCPLKTRGLSFIAFMSYIANAGGLGNVRRQP